MKQTLNNFSKEDAFVFVYQHIVKLNTLRVLMGDDEATPEVARRLKQLVSDYGGKAETLEDIKQFYKSNPDLFQADSSALASVLCAGIGAEEFNKKVFRSLLKDIKHVF